MKFIKGYKLISQEELSKLETDAEVRGAKESKQRIDGDILEALQRKNLLDEIYLAMHSPVNGEFKKTFLYLASQS